MHRRLTDQSRPSQSTPNLPPVQPPEAPQLTPPDPRTPPTDSELFARGWIAVVIAFIIVIISITTCVMARDGREHKQELTCIEKTGATCKAPDHSHSLPDHTHEK